MVSWTAGMNSIRYTEWDGTSWSGVYTAAASSAVDDGRIACSSAGDLWLVYGARGDDLQWDLRASTPDPAGIDVTEENIAFSIVNSGSNPVSSQAVFYITAPGESILSIHDMTGRIVHTSKVNPGDYSWNCNSMASGIYMVRVSSGNSTSDLKLVLIKQFEDELKKGEAKAFPFCINHYFKPALLLVMQRAANQYNVIQIVPIHLLSYSKSRWVDCSLHRFV